MGCFPIQCMPASAVLSTWGVIEKGQYTRGSSSEDSKEAARAFVSQTNSTFERTNVTAWFCVLFCFFFFFFFQFYFIKRKGKKKCKTHRHRYMGKQPTLFSFFFFLFLVRSFGIAVSLFLKLVCY